MGVKHLVRVENFLEENKGEYFSMSHLRRALNLNLDCAEEALTYLLIKEKITTIKNREVMYYGYPTNKPAIIRRDFVK